MKKLIVIGLALSLIITPVSGAYADTSENPSIFKQIVSTATSTTVKGVKALWLAAKEKLPTVKDAAVKGAEASLSATKEALPEAVKDVSAKVAHTVVLAIQDEMCVQFLEEAIQLAGDIKEVKVRNLARRLKNMGSTRKQIQECIKTLKNG